MHTYIHIYVYVYYVCIPFAGYCSVMLKALCHQATGEVTVLRLAGAEPKPAGGLEHAGRMRCLEHIR